MLAGAVPQPRQQGNDRLVAVIAIIARIIFDGYRLRAPLLLGLRAIARYD